jgi:hypothetical protein
MAAPSVTDIAALLGALGSSGLATIISTFMTLKLSGKNSAAPLPPTDKERERLAAEVDWLRRQIERDRPGKYWADE